MDKEYLSDYDVDKLKTFLKKYPCFEFEAVTTMLEGYVDLIEPDKLFTTPLVRCAKGTIPQVDKIIKEVWYEK